MILKPYQGIARQHIQAHERCNVFMSPGMGKTLTVLSAFDALDLCEPVFPALAIGPLRVANSVWPREVEKWGFDLKVSRILGTLEERMAGLKAHADIYTIHYGLLQWLTAVLGDKWPFRSVIADESTKLKHSRCSYRRHKDSGKVYFMPGGTANAASIARVAHKAKRWVNLTGTPAPNGLKDLWGQNWYVDFGKSLGSTYSAFQTRWFYSPPSASASVSKLILPFPHAEKEITERIKPHTISLDAYDWFDCARPREVKIPIELPPSLRAQYKTLHRDAVLKLNEQVTIVAANAAIITGKCLQFGSGHCFDGNQVAHHVHDLKLDALESLIEDLDGAPLIVVYGFTPDRDAILKRFKFAKVLPSGPKQQEVEDEWNAGKIPLLVLHGASAGHGLNLQYGGCNICIYTPSWDLELYEQVIERIGPVRQMQAGFKRIVSVYHLIMENTFDGVVCERRLNKSAGQQSIRDLLRVECN